MCDTNKNYNAFFKTVPLLKTTFTYFMTNRTFCIFISSMRLTSVKHEKNYMVTHLMTAYSHLPPQWLKIATRLRIFYLCIIILGFLNIKFFISTITSNITLLSLNLYSIMAIQILYCITSVSRTTSKDNPTHAHSPNCSACSVIEGCYCHAHMVSFDFLVYTIQHNTGEHNSHQPTKKANHLQTNIQINQIALGFFYWSVIWFIS